MILSVRIQSFWRHHNLDFGVQEAASFLGRGCKFDRQNLRAANLSAASGAYPDDFTFETLWSRAARFCGSDGKDGPWIPRSLDRIHSKVLHIPHRVRVGKKWGTL